MKKSVKPQLKAMNSAILTFTDEEIKKEKLSYSQSNTVKQNVSFNEPYNNIKVLKSGKIYETMNTLSNDAVKTILEVKQKEETTKK